MLASDATTSPRSGEASWQRVRKRAAQRTALACTFCRQRKARCSGEWPQCRNCRSRRRDCVYPGDNLAAGILPRGEIEGPEHLQLPSQQQRISAVAFFRENYASSLLCFLPPQQLVEDPSGERLPLPLLLCIVALTSRFLPDFNGSDHTTTESTGGFTEWASREVDKLSNEPALITIQCYLILCLIHAGNGLEHEAWLRVGHACRLTQLARLHKEDLGHSSFNWGAPRSSPLTTELEVRRRTFWCVFCLDRLLANGRDRIASFMVEDITTRLPRPDEDFIFGRECKTCRLTDGSSPPNHSRPVNAKATAPESLFCYTIRIINILGNVVLWQGRGGRRRDTHCPWLPGTPFDTYANELASWRARLPIYWDYRRKNVSLVMAAGQGKLWSLMFMFYFQAKTYLYREYVPFTPTKSYDPAAGPSDDTPLSPMQCTPPTMWWRDWAAEMVESANSTADLFQSMQELDLGPYVYPFTGLSLFTAASIHAIFTIFEWQSITAVGVSREKAKRYLSISLRGFNSIGQYWDLPIYWIRQISLYYKLNYLTRLSFSTHHGVTDASDNGPLKMNIQDVKDGVMNFLRQLSPQDRSSRRLNLKPMFDFEGWISAIESDSDKAQHNVTHQDRHSDTHLDGGRSISSAATTTLRVPVVSEDWHHGENVMEDASDSTSCFEERAGEASATSAREPQTHVHRGVYQNLPQSENLQPEDFFFGAADAFLPTDAWDDLSLEAANWDNHP